MSPAHDQEWLCDGIAEEILNALAQVRGIRVTARTSAFAFKGKNEDIRHIAAALGVQHVLEGSVRRAGDRIRVTAQLGSGRRREPAVVRSIPPRDRRCVCRAGRDCRRDCPSPQGHAPAQPIGQGAISRRSPAYEGCCAAAINCSSSRPRRGTGPGALRAGQHAGPGFRRAARGPRIWPLHGRAAGNPDDADAAPAVRLKSHTQWNANLRTRHRDSGWPRSRWRTTTTGRRLKRTSARLSPLPRRRPRRTGCT